MQPDTDAEKSKNDSIQGGQNTVASLARDQINSIYDTAPPNQLAGAEVENQGNPYKRTHDSEKSAANWQEYHSAWQNYYQQYYHRYYLAKAHNQNHALHTGKVTEEASHNLEHLDPRQHTIMSEKTSNDPRKEAVSKIKDELTKKVSGRARKVKSSHHFWPIVSAVVVGLLFLAIQYNQLIQGQILSYISPGSANPQNIILDASSNVKVGPNPELIIPKINVDIPIIFTPTTDDNAVEADLQNGVVHYALPGAQAVPGQIGNGVLLGHSTNDVFDKGSYKFAFLFLDRLQTGDIFYINYQSIRYTYIVTGSKVIHPSQVSELVTSNGKPTMSLVTCVPIGTSLNRLVVNAEQISPDPSKAAPAVATTGNSSSSTSIPGNAPTLLQQLFGG